MSAEKLAANAAAARGVRAHVQGAAELSRKFTIDVPEIPNDGVKKTTPDLARRLDDCRDPGRITTDFGKFGIPEQRAKVLKYPPQLRGSSFDKAVTRPLERFDAILHLEQVCARWLDPVAI